MTDKKKDERPVTTVRRLIPDLPNTTDPASALGIEIKYLVEEVRDAGLIDLSTLEIHVTPSEIFGPEVHEVVVTARKGLA